MADSVKIKITGDDSAYRSMLGGLGSVTKTTLKGLTAATAAVSAAWSAVGAVGVKYNASIEQLQTSFEVMTGSAEKGAAVLERIRKLGATTPFETEGLASTVQLLMNYNLTADDAVEKMTMLGDVSQGNQEKLTRIATAYGQMSSAGKVSLEDIKQMIEAGFNPLAEISESTGESMASLYDRISKGTLSIDEITASMERSTSAGGKYFQSMEKQSQTLNGQLSTLKDNAMSLLGDVLTPVTDRIRDQLLPMANDLLGEFASAFESGGFDGLLDAITGKIPALLDATISAGNKIMTGLVNWLPGAFKKVAQVLPTALRGVLDMGPELVSALFEVVSSLVQDLITMLPELIPMIVEGIGNLVPAIINGIGGLWDAVFDGLDNVLIDIGVKSAGIEKTVDRLLGNYDENRVRELKETWNATVDVTVSAGDYQTKIDTEMQKVRDALTSIESLDDAQKSAIEQAIINGTGIDVLEIALKDAGVPAADILKVTSTITSARDGISNAVHELGLSESAEAHITELINGGADAAEIKAALIQLGVPDTEADKVVATYTDGMNKISEAASTLNLDGTLLSGILTGALSDQQLIATALGYLGVDATTISTIVGSYDVLSNSLVAKVTGVYQAISDALTDGKADTPEVIAELEEQVRGLYGEAIDDVEGWVNDEISKLDINSAAYDEEVANIKAQGETMKSSLMEQQAQTIQWISEMAGLSTAEVQARLGELGQIEEAVRKTIAEIEAAREATGGQTAQAVEVTRSGAVRSGNAEVAVQAFAGSFQQYKLDIQALEDQFAADKAALLETFSDENSEEYIAAIDKLEQQFETAKQQELTAYQQTVSELMQGLMESLEADNPELADKVNRLIQAIAGQTELDTLEQDAYGADGSVTAEQISQGILDAYAQAYGETITPEALAEKINAYSDDLSMGDVFKNQLFESLRKSLEETATDGLEGEDLGFVGDVLQTAIQSGAFENFTAEGFDLTEPKNVLLALGGELSTSVADGITLEGAKMAEAMASQAEAIPQAAKDTLQEASPSKVMDSIGQNAGEGLARGLLKKYRAVYSAAKSLAKAAELGASITLEVHSPSKVFERLGLFSGQGFEEGYTESIRNAVQTVRRITGSLIDAANFPSGMSMPDVTRAVSTAIDSTSGPEQPIYLQVNGKTLASVTAEDNRQALNARSRRLAMGVGK